MTDEVDELGKEQSYLGGRSLAPAVIAGVRELGQSKEKIVNGDNERK